METLVHLLSLPEAQNQEPESCKDFLNFLLQPLTMDTFYLPGFNNLPFSKFLKILIMVSTIELIN